MPDNEIEEFNKKALSSIIEETGYSKKEAEEFHKNLQYYFGGNYEAFTTGQAPNETKIIEKGLSKMPAYDGKIYRGMGFLEDYIDDYEKFRTAKEGSVITMPSISSWTSDREAASGFGGLPEAYRDTVLIVCNKNKTGVGVQHISKFRDVEAEVLARSDAKWQITSTKTQNSYDVYAEYLESINDESVKKRLQEYLDDAELDFRSHCFTVIEVEEI